MRIGHAGGSFGHVREQKTVDLPASGGNAHEIDCSAANDAQVAIVTDESAICTFAVDLASANTNFGSGDYQNLISAGITIPIVGESRSLFVKRRTGAAVVLGLSYSLVEETGGQI